MTEFSEDSTLHGLEPIRDLPIASPEVISSLAMNFALKWHDMCMVKDGSLYQAKRAEGQNFTLIDIGDVLETAARFERWLLDAPERLLKILEKGEIEIVVHEGEHAPDGDL